MAGIGRERSPVGHERATTATEATLPVTPRAPAGAGATRCNAATAARTSEDSEISDRGSCATIAARGTPSPSRLAADTGTGRGIDTDRAGVAAGRVADRSVEAAAATTGGEPGSSRVEDGGGTTATAAALHPTTAAAAESARAPRPEGVTGRRNRLANPTHEHLELGAGADEQMGVHRGTVTAADAPAGATGPTGRVDGQSADVSGHHEALQRTGRGEGLRHRCRSGRTSHRSGHDRDQAHQ